MKALFSMPPAYQRQRLTDWVHEARNVPLGGPKNVTCGQIAEALVARIGAEVEPLLDPLPLCELSDCGYRVTGAHYHAVVKVLA